MATIKPIEGRSIHQIQSGQVIVDLCSVVKELVENSLDAGATSIDVRLKNQGLDAIEVQDNGSGIGPEDFESLALKHYTSKLTSYDDLESLDTFGFRGEALSSLSALSKLSIITTRAEDAPKGSKLEFEISGRLGNKSTIASTKGTAVAVSNIFYNYPVRRRELEKNIKREYGKVLGILHAYACISTGVRFSVSNIDKKGKKTVVFSTKSNPTTRENIANIYGAKTLLALVPLDLQLEMESSSSIAAKFAQNGPAERQVIIEGHISRPASGEGRQLPDRQMFFVNSRPCGLPQVSKAFNEVYKSFNMSQSPFIFANLKMDTGSYDVNVSPDKRTIMLHDQGELLESLKTALVEMFGAQDQTMPQAQLLQKTQTPLRQYPAFANTVTGPKRPIDEQSSPYYGNGGSRAADNDPSSTVELADTSSTVGTPNNLIQKFASRLANVRNDSAGAKSLAVPHVSNKKRKVSKAFAAQSPTDDGHSAQVDLSDTEGQEREPAAHGSPLFIPEGAEEPPASPHDSEQEEIPSTTTTPRRSQPGVVQSAFDRMRFKRRSPDIATVTIGDETTQVPIGSTPHKQGKIAKAKSTERPTVSKKSAREFKSGLALFAAIRSAGEDTYHPIASQMDESEDEESQAGSPAVSSEPAESDLERVADSPDRDTVNENEEALEESQGNLAEESRVPRDGPNIGEASESELPADEPLRGESDDEYIDEGEAARKHQAKEDARVARLIAEAEKHSSRPTDENLKRTAKALTPRPTKTSTFHLQKSVKVNLSAIERRLRDISDVSLIESDGTSEAGSLLDVEDRKAEERLSLTVSKADFTRMRVVGQFNKGFILATRPDHATNEKSQSQDGDELFIIDQHASDEKFNFERLQAETIVQNQRLVQPRRLELTAIEEETILNRPAPFQKNGFTLDIDTSGAHPVGQRCSLLSLPMSRDTKFDIRDLEELIALVDEQAVGSDVPRPSKVRRMFAMRACRGSIMVGDELTMPKMRMVVRHMGEIDKPWNCPHGRPTMRHLFALGGWRGWKEGDRLADGVEELDEETDWPEFLSRYGQAPNSDEEDEGPSSGNAGPASFAGIRGAAINVDMSDVSHP
ncbi:DNA mismatch repair protein MutL [Eremomyces bilateralis CBS 781.70]|uniref:DNA mismatch repair protein PMS1 n=1 Tax=Eremomyces bilateralis CBS 781.70 TaxID=1392243 RepID=A0A6G1G0J7_9PEZI|nr:DNA mismatch repair protein MutL [Eremomyces bilateralis CBS 781.70]KAF1811635.1 DNA mismatch repair protein MutL [Eremomyces bilateralis CBS 781.70]